MQNFRALAVEKNSAQKFRRQRWIPQTIEHDFIFLLDLISRMNEALGEVAIVGEKEESFALGVEPADVERAAGDFAGSRSKIVSRACGSLPRGNEAGRFV